MEKWDFLWSDRSDYRLSDVNYFFQELVHERDIARSRVLFFTTHFQWKIELSLSPGPENKDPSTLQ
jgi:hypothetical protein